MDKFFKFTERGRRHLTSCGPARSFALSRMKSAYANPSAGAMPKKYASTITPSTMR